MVMVPNGHYFEKFPPPQVIILQDPYSEWCRHHKVLILRGLVFNIQNFGITTFWNNDYANQHLVFGKKTFLKKT